MRLNTQWIKFINLLILVFLVIFVVSHLSGSRLECALHTKYQQTYSKCEAIHIGIVWISYQSNFYIYNMLKSLYFYRNNLLHIHIIVDDTSEKILQNMFDRWNVPQVNLHFYNVNSFSSYSCLTLENAKLLFPKIIPTSITSKIIVLNTNLIFTGDIYELWTQFDYFNKKQAIGLVENQNDKYLETLGAETGIIGNGFNADVILLKLEVLKTATWEELLIRSVHDIISLFQNGEVTDQNIINAVVSENSDLLYVISCHWNTQISMENYNCHNKNQIKVVNWNSPTNVLSTVNNGDYFRILQSTFFEYDGTFLRMQLRDCVAYDENTVKPTIAETSKDNCEDFREAYTYQWRTLLFFRQFKYSSSKYDVTLASHLTYDRLPILEKLVERWEGPMSIVLLATDSELRKCMNFIENSKLLQNRFNIAYHAIFKENYHHPINLCRNIALRNVVTPYVFLNDIDFVPMQGIYESLKEHLSSIEGMEAKVLVVPAFETNKENTPIPKTKTEILKSMDKKLVFQFMVQHFPEGHGPTNYAKWRTEQNPYKVKWQFKYEPYVVVQSNITGYDERFVGYGWNKVSYFTKLKAQGYDFIVLPNVFIVHKTHSAAREKAKFLKSARYGICLKNLMKHVIKELNEKYGTRLKFK